MTETEQKLQMQITRLKRMLLLVLVISVVPWLFAAKEKYDKVLMRAYTYEVVDHDGNRQAKFGAQIEGGHLSLNGKDKSTDATAGVVVVALENRERSTTMSPKGIRWARPHKNRGGFVEAKLEDGVLTFEDEDGTLSISASEIVFYDNEGKKLREISRQ